MMLKIKFCVIYFKLCTRHVSHYTKLSFAVLFMVVCLENELFFVLGAVYGSWTNPSHGS